MRSSVVDSTYRDIKSMKTRGALKIAIAAAKAINSVVKGEARDTKDMLKKLESAGARLKKARPTAVSLPNAVNYVLYVARQNKSLGLREFKSTVSSETQEFIKTQESSIQKIAEIGARLINKGDTVLTHCNSKTAVGVIKKAWDNTKGIKAVCTESRPRYQGHITAKELSSHGVPTTMIVDSAVHHTLRELEVDKVVVGADTIYSNGDLVNKIGTSQIALMAQSMDIDFIVAAESIKFSPGSILGKSSRIEDRGPREVLGLKKFRGVEVLNPAFDVTSAEHISAIVTEYGVIPPQAVYHMLTDKFSWMIEL